MKHELNVIRIQKPFISQFHTMKSKMYIQRNSMLQVICPEALGFMLPSPFEHVPKLFRSCSEALWSKPPPQYLLNGDKRIFL